MIQSTAAEFAYQYPLLIKSILATGVTRSPNQEIVSGNIRRYSYKDLESRVHRLANGLSAIGVSQGDTVAVMDWDTHRYFECFFAVPMMGATLHTINIRLAPEQILYTINHAEDDVILVHSDFLPLIDQIADRFERKITLVVMHDNDDISMPKGYVANYESLVATSSALFDFLDIDENSIATTFYTTGTTGDPKGVYYSHRQIVLHTLAGVASLSSMGESYRLHGRDVYMPLTPLFHVHGWGIPYMATLLGIKQVYAGKYEPGHLVNLLVRERATYSHCVPTILQMVLSHPDAEAADLSQLKVIIGGAAMPLGLVKLSQQFGIQLFAGYGMSETCPLLTIADMTDYAPDDYSQEANIARTATGRATAMVELRVVDENMIDVPRDGQSTGEVVTRTPWLTQGYSKNIAGSNALWKDGYLHTGDVGYLDEAGSLHITDRMKDVIKSGGEWISSLELENIASTCGLVAEVAAIGVTDARWGERPILLVVPTKDADSAECQRQIKQIIEDAVGTGKLSKWARPDQIQIVDQIEKTSVGKIDKKLLRSRFNA
ncbi:MAG: fatty acid--CoA ligase [Acidiferrobacterales bacterium]|nr:fatty acid--CoA ligase [Acidiferrobacterales bacterium]